MGPPLARACINESVVVAVEPDASRSARSIISEVPWVVDGSFVTNEWYGEYGDGN